jgi:hypothetical protein
VSFCFTYTNVASLLPDKKLDRDKDKEKRLDEVIATLRRLVPLNGLAPKERLSFPKMKEVREDDLLFSPPLSFFHCS